MKQTASAPSSVASTTNTTINGSDIKFAFIGNVDACPNACEAQNPTTPNNDGV